jgi:hypothetical protein
MPRTATTEEVARALHVGPATVRKYARQSRVPFDTTPGGHRRFDVDEAVAALTGGSGSSEQAGPPVGTDAGGALDTPYVQVEPEFSVTVTCALAAVGDAPVGAYDTGEDRAVWAVETAVV